MVILISSRTLTNRRPLCEQLIVICLMSSSKHCAYSSSRIGQIPVSLAWRDCRRLSKSFWGLGVGVSALPVAASPRLLLSPGLIAPTLCIVVVYLSCTHEVVGWSSGCPLCLWKLYLFHPWHLSCRPSRACRWSRPRWGVKGIGFTMTGRAYLINDRVSSRLSSKFDIFALVIS